MYVTIRAMQKNHLNSQPAQPEPTQPNSCEFISEMGRVGWVYIYI